MPVIYSYENTILSGRRSRAPRARAYGAAVWRAGARAGRVGGRAGRRPARLAPLAAAAVFNVLRLPFCGLRLHLHLPLRAGWPHGMFQFTFSEVLCVNVYECAINCYHSVLQAEHILLCMNWDEICTLELLVLVRL